MSCASQRMQVCSLRYSRDVLWRALPFREFLVLSIAGGSLSTGYGVNVLGSLRRSGHVTEGIIDPDASDEALAHAARDDPREFVWLYERYVARIYRYCRLRLNDPASAEDATSDVFLRALERIGGYRGGSFGAWLFAITRNVVIDTYRQRKPVGLEAVPVPEASAPTPEDWAVASAERDALRGAIAGLTDDQRTVIELQLAGWTGPQIAAAIDRSPEAVKMLRYRAMRRMRELLMEMGWGEDCHDG